MVYYIEYKNYSKGYFCQYESHIFQGIWLLLWSLKHQLILTIFCCDGLLLFDALYCSATLRILCFYQI